MRQLDESARKPDQELYGNPVRSGRLDDTLVNLRLKPTTARASREDAGMQKVFKPMEVHIDNEETDDGFFSLGFVFDRDIANAPHNLGLCLDSNEKQIKTLDFAFISCYDRPLKMPPRRHSANRA